MSNVATSSPKPLNPFKALSGFFGRITGGHKIDALIAEVRALRSEFETKIEHGLAQRDPTLVTLDHRTTWLADKLLVIEDRLSTLVTLDHRTSWLADRLIANDERIPLLLDEKFNAHLITVGDVITAELNDITSVGFHEATRDASEYALRAMHGAKIYRSAHSRWRGDDGASRQHLLKDAFNLAALDGLVLEFGVASGVSIRELGSYTDETIYGFDSFEGLPEGWFGEVQRGAFDMAGILPSVPDNVRLIAGWFEDTLSSFLEVHPGSIKFLHVDCDIYSSTKTIFQHLKDRIRPGTIIVFDEYFNYPTWRDHEYKAFQEFITESGLRYRYLGYNARYYSVSVAIE